jgi:hypothetical protein
MGAQPKTLSEITNRHVRSPDVTLFGALGFHTHPFCERNAGQEPLRCSCSAGVVLLLQIATKPVARIAS